MANVDAAIQVSVIYALPEEQVALTLDVPQGTHVSEAILRSGILQRFPQIDLSRQAVGVFGQRVALEREVEDGDRIEIYRPLIADPKEARKRRAQQQRGRQKEKRRS